MADKIPYETLLPVALALYEKIPHSVGFSIKPNTEKGQKRAIEEEAEDFATFYHCLHNRLIDTALSDSMSRNQS